MFPREQRERGDDAMVPVTGEADAVVVSGPEQRRGRVMKNAIQKTECHELSDAELKVVIGGDANAAGAQVVKSMWNTIATVDKILYDSGASGAPIPLKPFPG